MKKKAELLEMAVKALRLELKNAEAMGEHKNSPLPADVIITPATARALAEALEGLRWVNMYRNDEHQLTIGNEYLNYTDANNRRVPDAIFIETVGIIRLKDDEQ